MFIEEVIIEGFKSYATRTVVSGFDAEFNAITGLNGSGKSNILDAICFVLGITNLSQVRAANLADLVYKQGQAGVTKASVCIVFNNADAKRSPVGYEAEPKLSITREVVIGGRNRYVINGRPAQAAQVANLFHSVQLNVNNPHFLIMQGRITKVLNMKPQEILSMVEEAAGTRMFETKKEQALKTLEKKQLKVEEIARVLAEDIMPTLERLRGEKANYLRWSANTQECHKLERFVTAANFCDAEAGLEKSAGDEAAARAAAEAKVGDADAADERVSELADAEAAARSESGAAGKAKKLRQKLSEDEESRARDEVQAEASLKSATTVLKADEASAASAARARLDFETSAAALAAAVSVAETDVSERTSARDSAQARADAAERLHRAAVAGVEDESEESQTSVTKSVAEQVADARDGVRVAQQRQRQAAKTGEALAKRRAETAKAALKSEDEVKRLDALVAKAEGKAAVAKQALDAHGAGKTAADADACRAAATRKRSEYRARKEAADRLDAQLRAQLAFDFSDPGQGFDKRKVRGVLARLVRPKSAATAVALEVVAGGKLFQVVVDDEQTGKALLERGKLQRRVTLVPLTKVQSHPLASKKCDAAKAAASKVGGSATVAIELVGFDGDVKAAIQYAFGSTLVCDTLDTARAVAFDASVRTKCVTLDGDVCDPAGTLSGGSANGHMGALLTKVAQLAEARADTLSLEAEVKTADALAAKADAEAGEHATLERLWSVAAADRDAAVSARGACAGVSAREAVAQLDAELSAASAEGTAAAAAEAVSASLVATLEGDHDAVERQREKELKRLEAAAKKLAKDLKTAHNALSEAQAKLRTLQAELSALRDDGIARGPAEGADVDASTRLVADATAALEAARSALKEQKAATAAARADLDGAEAAARALATERSALQASAIEARLEAKRLGIAAGRCAKDRDGLAQRVKAMHAKHEWLDAERPFFGTPGSDYDFGHVDVPAARSRLGGLQEQQAELAKKVNKRVMGLIDTAERSYDDLKHKQDVCAGDRGKIEAVIAELDIKKRETLVATCAKVDRDFGSIFSSLLPGARAKLEPPPGCDVLDGLEVKVAFGSIWKESLSELSGGQRSLIALSLVLAMLLFKPAPMYILDEVDAALDLSHTQNIGTMLRAHFKASQFIVVSLKEGMFNNANVIFRTKFVEGISTVQRTITKHHTTAEEKKKAKDKAKAMAVKN
ncbi:RecF/RecN/SMC [Pelagophyceae sp. CCMP2097]|nr:RecF/RecN/SMC [Pelagophyceae sp. CCMP2097]|mmetsp:Transcript_3984/g.14660  ORF Transcript_3984/g.14660 Transcript_3984/m.14660 type:complete len:1206 (+) Transcript_3984:200-3817(+)